MNNQTPSPPATPPGFTSYQKEVVAILAFVQFTIILDFMILSPLGAILMPAMKISPGQFGSVVSAYAFSAGIAGFLAAGFADQFDRKKMLLFFYAGFLVGTLMCALAPNFHFLMIARIVTGLFAGVMGSIAFAIITDLFAYEKRGRVMGVVQTAFAASQVLGIPVGLFFANIWGWHSPFMMIVFVGVVMGFIIAWRLKPVNAHLAEGKKSPALGHLIATVSKKRYLKAFSTTALLSTGGFMMMPFGSAYSVNNLGIHIEQIPMIYMCVGVSSIIFGPIIGRLSDSMGKFPIFLFGSLLTSVMVLIYTHLGITPVAVLIVVNALMFVGISSRMISSGPLISVIPDPASRGAFMAVNSSIQQISGGIAAVVAGLIVVETGGKLEHFDIVGYVVVATSIITAIQMYFISREVHKA